MSIIIYNLLLVAMTAVVLSAPTDESSVLVESPPLYIHRMPQRRSRMNNLDARPQIPDEANNNTSVYSDVEVSEMMSNEVQEGGFVELAMIPGSRQFYLVLAISLSLLMCLVTILLWFLCCRPKPVPRRYNPRYDGAAPKRLSKLSFRAFRYSMTGNQQLKSNRYRASEPHMEPAQPVSTVSVVSTG